MVHGVIVVIFGKEPGLIFGIVAGESTFTTRSDAGSRGESSWIWSKCGPAITAITGIPGITGRRHFVQAWTVTGRCTANPPEFCWRFEDPTAGPTEVKQDVKYRISPVDMFFWVSSHLPWFCPWDLPFPLPWSKWNKWKDQNTLTLLESRGLRQNSRIVDFQNSYSVVIPQNLMLCWCQPSWLVNLVVDRWGLSATGCCTRPMGHREVLLVGFLLFSAFNSLLVASSLVNIGGCAGSILTVDRNLRTEDDRYI